MEVALSTLFLLIFLLPGLIFRRFYYTGPFSKQYNNSTFFKLLLASFIPSLVFHTMWYGLSSILRFPTLDVELLAPLLTKIKPEATFTNIKQNSLNIFWYHFTMSLFSATFGLLLQRFVRWKGLDRRYKILRFQNSWHYLFKGEFFDFRYSEISLEDENTVKDIEFFFLDVLTEIAGTPILYEGVLVDYELSVSGELNTVTIASVSRRILFNGENKQRKDSPSDIDGSVLVLPYCNIKNINLAFYKLLTFDSEGDLEKEKYNKEDFIKIDGKFSKIVEVS